MSERRAEPGERCTCGRQAIVVFEGSVFGATGFCGVHDGGDRTGPCPFCGGPRHTDSRCPDYRLRLEDTPADGAEPDRAAEFEQARRGRRLGREEVTPNEQP